MVFQTMQKEKMISYQYQMKALWEKLQHIQKKELQAKNAELIKLKEDLSAEMEFINSADYIEQQARKDLKMIKENELLFIISDEDDKE